jgi:hypothetical protein
MLFLGVAFAMISSIFQILRAQPRARLAAHPKFVWVFNAKCAETIIYNDPVACSV